MTVRTGRARRWGAATLAVALTGLVSGVASLPGNGGHHRASPTAAAAQFRAASGVTVDAAKSTAVTKSKTIQRTYLDNGKTTVVDRRKVTLNVAQTQGLRSRQLVHVTWSGAHQTGGIQYDQNSDLAQNEEYSFDLFECRGTDTAAHPISPDDCWTQYADERFNYGYDDPAYPAWRSDALAPAAERAAYVNRPSSLNSVCKSTLFQDTFERWIPFDAAGKTTYQGGPFGCAGLPPEADPANSSSSQSLPTNETYGVTGADGRGSTDFDIFTGEDHASLGCSATQPCSLVAVPIDGISCDPEGAKLPSADRPDADDADVARQNCETNGVFAPGAISTGGIEGAPAVDGSLWWSASNWANRIAVPLTFAPADDVCAAETAEAPVPIYGSEVLAQATTSWAPYFCLNPKLFDFNHVKLPEPEARSLLAQGNIQAAFTSDPPDAGTPYPTPTVNAPTAISGFGIAVDLDDGKQQPITSVKLDARLIAKLLTESYPDQPFIKSAYPALSKNPYNITFDPEFQALNPGVPEKINDAASTLLTLSSNSDLVYALTSYINADPEARAWLNGAPDPWGMVVNPNYKKIALPVNNWPLQDSFVPSTFYQGGNNPCLHDDPVPWLPLVADPTSYLFTIAQDMQFALAQPQIVCIQPSPTGGSAGEKLVPSGRQGSGFRVMFGTVDLGDAARAGLTLASLQTSSTVKPGTQFTSAAGRTFAAPDQAGLAAAARTLTPDKSTGTWSLPYDKLTDGTDADAYPGTMVVYTAVPTKGLDKSDAKDFSEFLSFAAVRGQVAGTAQADLPAGYLPMTAANGVGALAAYTTRAAAAVAAQQGALPSLTGAGSPPPPNGHSSSTPAPSSAAPSPHPTAASSSTPTGNASSSPANQNGSSYPSVGTSSTPGGNGSTSPLKSSSPAPSPSSSPSPSVSGSGGSTTVLRTSAYNSTVSGVALPGLLIIAIVGLISMAVIRLRAGGRAR